MKAQVRIFAALVAVPLLFIAAGANNAETAVPEHEGSGKKFLRAPQKDRDAANVFLLPPQKERDPRKMFLRSAQNER